MFRWIEALQIANRFIILSGATNKYGQSCKPPHSLSFSLLPHKTIVSFVPNYWRFSLRPSIKLILCYLIVDDGRQIVWPWQKWWRIVGENADSVSFSSNWNHRVQKLKLKLNTHRLFSISQYSSRFCKSLHIPLRNECWWPVLFRVFDSLAIDTRRIKLKQIQLLQLLLPSNRKAHTERYPVAKQLHSTQIYTHSICSDMENLPTRLRTLKKFKSSK